MNKKSYTIDKCVMCDKEYKRFACNRSNTCQNGNCRKRFYNNKTRISPEHYQPMYPLSVSEQKRRYTRLRNEMDKCETREEKTIYYDNVFKEMEDTGIMKWCMRLQTNQKRRRNIDENGNPKVGRLASTSQQIPSTKDMPY